MSDVVQGMGVGAYFAKTPGSERLDVLAKNNASMPDLSHLNGFDFTLTKAGGESFECSVATEAEREE